MSTDTTARISFFDLAIEAIGRTLSLAGDLVVELSDADRWEALATRDETLKRALAEAQLTFQPPALALEEALRSLPVLDQVTLALPSGHRAAAQRALRQARELEAEGFEQDARQAYVRAEEEHRRAIEEANRLLAPIEVQTGRALLADALRDLGYDDLRVSRAGDLRARRTADGKIVYARIDERGALEVGLAGHDGLTCQRHTEEIFEALRRRGAEVRDRRTDVHGCRAGGRVARAAEARAAIPAEQEETAPRPDEHLRRRNRREAERRRPPRQRARTKE